MKDEEFTVFVNQCRPPLLDYISCLVQDEEVAENIVQESFIRAWKRNLGKKDKPRSFVFKIAFNLCMDFFRKRKVREDYLCYAKTELPKTPEEILMWENFSKEVNDIINKTLPKNMKKILILRTLEGKTAFEMSNIFGISKSAVNNYLYRARKKLRKELVSYSYCY